MTTTGRADGKRKEQGSGGDFYRLRPAKWSCHACAWYGTQGLCYGFLSKMPKLLVLPSYAELTSSREFSEFCRGGRYQPTDSDTEEQKPDTDAIHSANRLIAMSTATSD